MKQVILHIGGLWLVALACSACGGVVGDPPATDEEIPPLVVQPKQRLGVDAYEAPAGEIGSLEGQMGRKFGAFSCYMQWDDATKFPNRDAQDARTRGALVYLNVNSHFANPDGTKSPVCWTAIAAGKRDRDIHAWADSIKAWGYQKNMLITFEHEANYAGDNQPKCPSDTPADYRDAFDRFHRLLRADGVTAPFAYMPLVGAFRDCVPGSCEADAYDPPHDDYLVIGTDTYNQPPSRGGQYKDAHEALDPFYDWVDAVVPGKLKFIGEIGEDAYDPEVGTWYATAVQIIKSRGGAEQLAVNWNIKDTPGHTYDPNLDPDAKAAFLTMAGEAYFGAGNGPGLVQQVKAKGSSDAASATLSGVTPGNLVVAVVAASGSPQVVPPSGWTAGPSADGPPVSLFYKVMSAGGDHTVTFGLAPKGGSYDWVLSLLEVRGVEGTIDRQATATSGTGTGAAVDSGTTAETRTNQEFLVAGLWENGTEAFGLLSSGFALANKVYNGSCSLLVAYKTQATTGARNTTVTLGRAAKWRGVIASFK